MHHECEHYNCTICRKPVEIVKNEDVIVEPERSRWIVLIAYCVFSLSNGIAWITYSPIFKQAGMYYDVSDLAIIQFSNVYMYTDLVLSFLVSWTIYRWPKVFISSSMILNALGCWLRYFAFQSY